MIYAHTFRAWITGAESDPPLDDIEIPISSCSIRRYESSLSASIVTPSIEYGDAIEARTTGNLVIKWYLNGVEIEEFCSVPITGLSIAEGARNISTTVYGKLDDPTYTPGAEVMALGVTQSRYDSDKAEVSLTLATVIQGLVPGVMVSHDGISRELISAQIECSHLTMSMILTVDATTIPVPPPVQVICDTSGYCNDRATDPLVYDPSYSESIRLGFVYSVPPGMDRYTAFVFAENAGIVIGTLDTVTLTFPGGTWSYSSSDYFEYDIKVKIYCAAVDSASIPADREELLATPKTSAFAQWHYDPQDYPQYTPLPTPDLSAPLQELIDRPGYTSSSNIMFILQSDEYPGGGITRWTYTLIQHPPTAQDWPVELDVSYK